MAPYLQWWLHIQHSWASHWVAYCQPNLHIDHMAQGSKVVRFGRQKNASGTLPSKNHDDCTSGTVELCIAFHIVSLICILITWLRSKVVRFGRQNASGMYILKNGRSWACLYEQLCLIIPLPEMMHSFLYCYKCATLSLSVWATVLNNTTTRNDAQFFVLL